MRLIRTSDYNDMSRKAANIISAHVILKGNSVLGLATGSTPIGIYKQLIEWYKKKDIDFSECTSFNLDEYVGLNEQSEQSYIHFMNENFFNHINIKRENINIPSGTTKNPNEECMRYEEKIKASGGIDLQLLGLGHNGHIGFNEPHYAFEQLTHVVDLDDKTIAANARFFESADQVPRQAVTMGIKTIMQAKQILLTVSGKDKAEILHKVMHGPVTPNIQGSILQMHPNVIVVADEAALDY